MSEFERIAYLVVLAVQTVTVGIALWLCVVKLEEANKLQGELLMKQEEFDKKVDGLVSKVDQIDAKSDAEASQVAGLVQNFKDEIARLQSEHPNLDTSRLDVLNSKLDEAATRISAIVPDEPQSSETAGESSSSAPAQTVDEPTQTVDAPAETVPVAADAVVPAPVEVEQTSTTETSISETDSTPAVETKTTETTSVTENPEG